MKIYAISDLHGQLEGLDPKGADLVLVAGDVAPMNGWSAKDLANQVGWVNNSLREWMGGYPKTQFRFIPGNHDLFAQNDEFLRNLWLPKNAKLLIDQEDEVDGLRIYGTPWVPYINGRWAFEERFPGQLKEKFAAIPKGIHILLSHTPPRISYEKVDVSIDTCSEPFGSPDLTDALLRIHPQYALCGHIHTGDHTPIPLIGPDDQETTVRNVSRLDEDYRIRYEPFVFEL